MAALTVEYALKRDPQRVRTVSVPASFVGYFGEFVSEHLDIPITDLVMAREKRTRTGRKSA